MLAYNSLAMRVFTTLFAFLVASASFAQGLYPHLDSKQEGAFLLVVAGVQKELKATPEQKKSQLRRPCFWAQSMLSSMAARLASSVSTARSRSPATR